jgi:predicted dehydrogenase
VRKLKMGMVGGGKDALIGAVHRRAALMDGKIEFTAGALSSTKEKALASGRDLGLPDERNYASWQEMLGCELELPEERRTDFVSIVTPNHLHFPVAHAFAEAGFNVVLDKPMVHTSQQAEDLMRVVEGSGVVFAVTYNYTGYPMVKQARHMVREGLLGEIRKVIVEYNQGWLVSRLEEAGAKQAEWRTDPARSGIAGAVGDIGSHAENLVSTITGLEVSEICADLTTFVGGRCLDDDGNLLIRYEGGAKGVMVTSQISAGEENDLRVRIYGTEGGLEWRQEEPTTYTTGPRRSRNGYSSAGTITSARRSRRRRGCPRAIRRGSSRRSPTFTLASPRRYVQGKSRSNPRAYPGTSRASTTERGASTL